MFQEGASSICTGRIAFLGDSTLDPGSGMKGPREALFILLHEHMTSFHLGDIESSWINMNREIKN